MQRAFVRYETRENASVGSRSDASDAFDHVKSEPLIPLLRHVRD